MSVKRLLDCTPSDLAAYSKTDLLAAIAGSEGRVLACETIGLTPPLLVDVTNAEYAASLSADILLLNMFDVQHPVINALPKVPEEETVREIKRLTGRVVGINLEPCDPQAAKSNDGTLWKMSSGRLATAENASRAADMGVDLIVLTGNPGNGVSNELIVESLKDISAAVGDRVMLAAGNQQRFRSCCQRDTASQFYIEYFAGSLRGYPCRNRIRACKPYLQRCGRFRGRSCLLQCLSTHFYVLHLPRRG